MIEIKTVLFDLGNVLAHIDFDEFWRSLGFFNQKERSPFTAGYKVWTLRYETGLISTSEYLIELQSVFGNSFNIAQLELAFANIMREPVEGMMDVVKQVSRTHQTALVSNTNEIHYKLSVKKFGVLSILHKRYLSYQLHVMKPASEFYYAIIKDQKIDPSEMLFIDDIETNVKGAQTAGMQAIRFEGIKKLNASLKGLLG